MFSRLDAYLTSIGISGDALVGWTIHSATRDGEEIGFVLTLGAEIHILPLCEKRSLSRRNILEYIAPLIERYGYAATRVPVSVTDHRLRERLGFVKTWENEEYSFWQMTELPYQKRKSSCQ